MEQISASDGCAGAPPREKIEKAKQVAWSLKNWCAALDISQSFAYELIAAGQIKTRKCGGKRLIETPPDAFLASLPGEGV